MLTHSCNYIVFFINYAISMFSDLILKPAKLSDIPFSRFRQELSTKINLCQHLTDWKKFLNK